eukprot:6782486-Pyramimonas_sp.AAC.1
MASMGMQYLGGTVSGDFALLWVATPADWYARLPDRRARPPYEKTTARILLDGNSNMRLFEVLNSETSGCAYAMSTSSLIVPTRGPTVPV